MKNRALKLSLTLMAMILSFAMGFVTLFASKPVSAEVETTYVSTEADLTTALGKDGNVVLGSDINVATQIVIPSSVTVVLDLNGYDIIGGFNGASTTNHIYVLSNYGALTVKDGGTDGAIVSRGVYNYGTLVLDGGTIDACDGNGGYAVNNETNSTFIMNGGIVTASYEDGDAPASGNYDATALDVPTGSTTTLNGGKIISVTNFTYAISSSGTLNVPKTSTIEVKGAHGALSVSGGTATIEGGKFICSGVQGQTDNVCYISGGAVNVSGGIFAHEGDKVNADSGAAVVMSGNSATLNISAGSFTGLNGSISGNANTTITGGSFDNVMGYDGWSNIKDYVEAGSSVEIGGETFKKEVASLQGEGTTASPFLINNLAELVYFRDQVNSGNVYKQKYVKLVGDIDLASVSDWTPIGNITNKFQGYFDGNNKTISNLTVLGNKNYAGLFGYVLGSSMNASAIPSVKDLTLTNVNVSGAYYVGGLSGQGYTCAIVNVTVEGKVTGERYIGGLVGHVYTYFKDCNFKGEATCTFDALGGIAGAGDCRAYDCTVVGTVSGSNWVGGIVGNGQEGASAVGCYVKATVSTSYNYYFGIGGIAGVGGHGYAGSEFKDNYFDGEVYLCDEKVNAIVTGIVNALNNDSIKTTISGNSWNTEYYPVDTPILVVADISSSNATPEEWANCAAERLTCSRNNNLVVLESDIQYIETTDINDVVIKDFSEATGTPAVSKTAVEEKVIDNTYVVKINGKKYASLVEAWDELPLGPQVEVEVLRSFEEDLTNPLFENYVFFTNVSSGVTITNNNDNDYIYLENVVVKAGVTIESSGIFFQGGENNVVEGKLIAERNAVYYQMSDSIVTIKNGGSVYVDGTTILRYNKDKDAGIYIYGDNDDSTIEFKCTYYIGSYSGTIYAEDANIEAGYYLLKGSYDNNSYSDITLKLNNSSLEITGTSDGQGLFEMNEDSNLELVNGSSLDVLINLKVSSTAQIIVKDSNIETKEAYIENGANIYVENGNISTDNGLNVLDAYSVRIGYKVFDTLQNALDYVITVKGNHVIEVFGTNNENVIVEQIEGVNITIKGNGVDTIFTGSIEIYGHNRYDGKETLTIEGITFTTDVDGHVFIHQLQQGSQGATTLLKAAPHNVTIKNCKFVATGSAVNTAAAIKFRMGGNIVIKDVVSTDMHSLIQAYAGVAGGMVIENVEITGKNGIALGTSQNVTIKNVKIDAIGYGLRADAQVDTKVVIDSCEIEAFIPVVVRKAEKQNYEIAFSGNNVMFAENSDGFWLAVGSSEYEENGVLPTASTEKVSVVIEDAVDSNGAIVCQPLTLKGNGTEVNPYLIRDVREFELFRDSVNAGETKYNAKNVYIKLASNLDLQNIEWTPIGTASVPFVAIFDGDGYTIKNLKVAFDKTYVSGGANENYAGLFGFMKGGNTAAIKNVTVENAEVVGCLYVGVILGRSYTGGIIENCYVVGNVKVDGYSYIGGIVGRHEYSSGKNVNGETMSIYNCSVVANPTGTINADYAVSYVGGIVGFLAEGNYVVANCSVQNVEIKGIYGVGGISGIAHYGNTIKGVGVEKVAVVSDQTGYNSANRKNNVGLIAGACQGTASQPSVIEDYVITDTVATKTDDQGTNIITDVFGSSMTGEAPVTNLVAKIGNKYFTSIQEAINAVQEGETIVLISNVTVTEPAYGQNALNFAKAVNCTIDLNGYTITADTGNSVLRFNIVGSGAITDIVVTLKNGTIISGDNTWCTVMAAGISEDVRMVLNLEDLTIESNKAGDLAVKAWDNGLINAKNVTVYANKSSGAFYAVGGEIVLDNCTVIQKGLYTAPYLSMAIAVSNGGKATVNSGNYSSEPTSASEGNNQGASHGSWVAGVMNSGGTLIINGGTFVNGNYGDDSLATAARGLLFVDTYGELIVNGGTFNALKGIIDYQNNLGIVAGNPKVTIFGGTYSAKVSMKYCAEDYGSVDNGNGTYDVIKLITGEGTEANPYVIATKEGLEYFRDSVNAGKEKFNATGVWVALGSDIDLAGSVWSSGIGGYYDFLGNFDGKNYTIKNLTIEVASYTYYSYAGLFGSVLGDVVIKDLVIENPTILCNYQSTSTEYCNALGVLVGFAWNCNNAIIENIVVKGDIRVDAIQASAVGAIVGYAYSPITIKGCSVIGNDGSYIKAVSQVGGIIGYSQIGDTLVDNCLVENVTITASNTNGYIGGIVGVAQVGNVFTNCTLKDVAIECDATAANVGIAVGSLSGTSVEVSNLTQENVSVSKDVNVVGGIYSTRTTIAASAGEIYFANIEDAIENANSGDVVTLLRDATSQRTINVASGKVITLDLNGFTLNAVSDVQGHSLLINKGELTVKNGTISYEFNGVADGSYGKGNYTITNSGTLIVENATIENVTAFRGHMHSAVDNNSTTGNAKLVLNSGKIVNELYMAVRQFANSTTYTNEVIVNGGEIIGGSRAIWAQLPGTDSSKAVKVSIIVNGGELTSLDTVYNLAIYVYSYGNSAANTELKINGGIFNGDVAINGTASASLLEGNVAVTGGNFNGDYGIYGYGDIAFGFISGGTFKTEIAEEYWAPGYVVIPQDGLYVAKDMVEFSIDVAEYLREVARAMQEEKVYSVAGVNAFENIVIVACDEIKNFTYMSEVERKVKSTIELFNKVLTEIEIEELAVEYLLDAKEYAELKKVDFNDQRIGDEFLKLLDCGLKKDMQVALANVYAIIDTIAEENALALKTAKDDAILELFGANNENVNNVTSAMITSIYASSTIEEVEFALNVAKVELQEIILYKGYVKNASDKADSTAIALGELKTSLSELSSAMGTNFASVIEKLTKALEDIALVKKDTESILSTAVDKATLENKLNEIQGKVEGIVGSVTDYIDKNVVTALSSYATETNKALGTLNTTITTLESVLGDKIDAVKDVVELIKPLTNVEVENILSTGLAGLDSKFAEITNKVEANGTAISNAVTAITNAINAYATETNKALGTLNTTITTLESVLGDKIDAVKVLVEAIKPLSKVEVENILSTGLAGLDSKFADITNKVEANGTAISNAVTAITEAIEEVATTAKTAAEKAQLAAEKATEAMNKVNEISSFAEAAKQAALDAKAAAEAAQQVALNAQQAALDAKAAAESLQNATNDSKTAAEAAKLAAEQAAQAALDAKDAAVKAAEKAQTAEVKAHASVSEAELKQWINEYLAQLGTDVSNGAFDIPEGIILLASSSNVTIIPSVDTYRDELIANLQDKYTEENAALVLSYYDLAMAQIAASVSKEEIDYAIENFKTNVSLVEYLDTLAPAPAYDDQLLIILLIVVAGVEAVIAVVAIVLLVKVSKGKKHGENGPEDDNTPTEETAVTEAVEAVEEVCETETPIEEESEIAPIEEAIEDVAVEPSEETPVEDTVEETEVQNYAMVENVEETDEEETEEPAEANAFAGIRGTQKTFEEKLLVADEVVKEGYKAITEELLSYKKVNPRLSKKALSFRTGRKLIAKMTIVGKTLRVYLALDPKAYDVTKLFQKDASDKKAYEEVPMLMRVKSGRATKRTVNLVNDLAVKFELVKRPANAVIDARFAFLHKNNFTFEDRLSMADIVIKQGYETIKEELLKYKKVNPRLSKKAISFRNGRKLIAKMTIVGKTLRVYLALDPNAYEFSKFFQRDVSSKKSYAEVPMLMRVKSGRAIKRTLKLIPDIAGKFGLVVKPEPKQ